MAPAQLPGHPRDAFARLSPKTSLELCQPHRIQITSRCFPSVSVLIPARSIYLSSTLLLTASAFEERRRSFLPRSPKTGRFKPKGRANSRAIVIATQATDVPTPALRYRSVFCRLLAKKCELKRDAIGLVM